MAGGAVSAAAVPGEPFPFPQQLLCPPEQLGPPGPPPPLAVRYGSVPDGDRSDRV